MFLSWYGFMKNKILVTAFLFLSVAALASDTMVLFEDSSGKTDFEAVGNPSAIHIHGKGKGPRGMMRVSGDKVEGKLEVDLNSFDTGMKLRNEHLKKKYLETDRYQMSTLEFKGEKIPGLDKPDTKLTKIPLTGMLTLHGVSKACPIEVSIDSEAGVYRVEGLIKLKITDYAIAVPQFMGVTVASDVSVEVQSRGLVQK